MTGAGLKGSEEKERGVEELESVAQLQELARFLM